MKIRALILFVLSLTMLVSSGFAWANTIGQWNGNGLDTREDLMTWNYENPPGLSPSYSTTIIRDLVTAAGHTVGPDAPITAANMAGYDSFIVRIPRLTPTATEMAILSEWVHEGGLLLMLADASLDSPHFNNILAGVGSTMSAGGSVNQNCFLIGGTFMTEGLTNQSMATSPGKRISGGTALTQGGTYWTEGQKADAAAYIRYERIGMGWVFAFADLSDVNYFTSPANKNLFLNAAGYENPFGSVPPPAQAPEPATLALLGIGLLGVAGIRKLKG